MLKISQQQISERWDILPMSLREALYSPEYGKTIWGIGVEHHLNDEKIGVIMSIAGYIVFGFIHPEDLAKEIQESLNLNPEIANSIAQEIDRKIFSPIKADLEKVYSPVSEAPEIKPTLPVQSPAELPVVSPVELKPTSLTEMPKAAEPTPVSPEKPPVVSEVEPFIIHEETKPKPIGEKEHLSFPSIGWFKKTPKTETPVKVELEIFGPKIEKKEPTIAKTEPPKQKVIHYREAPTTTPFGPAPVPPPTPTLEPLKTEPPKLEPPKPEEPKVINLNSFE